MTGREKKEGGEESLHKGELLGLTPEGNSTLDASGEREKARGGLKRKKKRASVRLYLKG